MVAVERAAGNILVAVDHRAVDSKIVLPVVARAVAATFSFPL
jgi:hypothetical protein